MNRHEHHVARLEIAVEHSLLVGSGQTCGDLREQLRRSGLGDRSFPPQPLGERLSLEQLHAQEQRRLIRSPDVQLEDPADVRVSDPPGQEDLSPEPLQATLGRALIESHRLQRDARSERHVDGLVDLAHAAPAEHPDDPEP